MLHFVFAQPGRGAARAEDGERQTRDGEEHVQEMFAEALVIPRRSRSGRSRRAIQAERQSRTAVAAKPGTSAPCAGLKIERPRDGAGEQEEPQRHEVKARPEHRGKEESQDGEEQHPPVVAAQVLPEPLHPGMLHIGEFQSEGCGTRPCEAKVARPL